MARGCWGGVPGPRRVAHTGLVPTAARGHFLPSSLPETQGARKPVVWPAKREASQPVAFKARVRTKTPRGLSAASSGAKWAPGIKKQERPLSG